MTTIGSNYSFNNTHSNGNYSNMNARPPGPPPSPFKDLDADGSGSLSEDELEKMASHISQMTGQTVTAEQLMAKLDTDGDGAVSAEEMEAGRPKGPPPELEASYDAALSQSQLSAFASQLSQSSGQTISTDELLEMVDANGDGEASRAEMQQMIQSQMNAIRMSRI